MAVVPLKKPAPCGPAPNMPHAAPIARPAREQHYVIPGSHWLDPPYAWQTPHFPKPRPPWAFESETRAPGTGLWWGGPHYKPPHQPPGPCGPAPKTNVPYGRP